MRRLFIVTAVLMLLLGVSWLLAPEAMLESWGTSGDPVTIYIARRYAVLFFGYAVLLWMARGAPASPARAAILAGSAVVACAIAAISLHGAFSGVVGPAIWIAVVVEVALAGAFGYYFLRERAGRGVLDGVAHGNRLERG